MKQNTLLSKYELNHKREDKSMWITTPVSTIQSDHFTTFEIVEIEDSPDDKTHSFDGIFAFRDGGVTIFRGSEEECQHFKTVLDRQLCNGHISVDGKVFFRCQ